MNNRLCAEQYFYALKVWEKCGKVAEEPRFMCSLRSGLIVLFPTQQDATSWKRILKKQGNLMDTRSQVVRVMVREVN